MSGIKPSRITGSPTKRELPPRRRPASASESVHPYLALQHFVGNQAVGQLIEERKTPSEEEAATAFAEEKATREEAVTRSTAPERREKDPTEI